MISRLVKLITGATGVVLMSAFVIGLSLSISSGFAGVRGGLPFAIIVILVLAMVVRFPGSMCTWGQGVNQAPLK